MLHELLHPFAQHPLPHYPFPPLCRRAEGTQATCFYSFLNTSCLHGTRKSLFWVIKLLKLTSSKSLEILGKDDLCDMVHKCGFGIWWPISGHSPGKRYNRNNLDTDRGSSFSSWRRCVQREKKHFETDWNGCTQILRWDYWPSYRWSDEPPFLKIRFTTLPVGIMYHPLGWYYVPPSRLVLCTTLPVGIMYHAPRWCYVPPSHLVLCTTLHDGIMYHPPGWYYVPRFTMVLLARFSDDIMYRTLNVSISRPLQVSGEVVYFLYGFLFWNQFEFRLHFLMYLTILEYFDRAAPSTPQKGGHIL